LTWQSRLRRIIMSNTDRIEFVLQHKDLVADALLQEAANLSGFGGKYKGEKLKQLERAVGLLRELAKAIRGLEEMTSTAM